VSTEFGTIDEYTDSDPDQLEEQNHADIIVMAIENVILSSDLVTYIHDS
jgi:hypothetical protein